MKFSLESKQVVLPSSTETTPTVESISYAYEGILTSYMELTDAQKNLDEVCQVMENIELSMKMIKTSDKAIECLNVDGSLESLCGTAELNVEKVTASLENAFTDTMKDFWEKVKAFFSRIVNWIKSLLPTREKVVIQTKEKIVEVVKEKVVTKEVVSKEDLFKKKSPVDNPYAHLLRKDKIRDLVNAVRTGVNVATGNTHDKISVKDLPAKYPQYFKENTSYPMPTWDYYETADTWTISGGDGVMISLSDLGYNSETDIDELAKAITVISGTSVAIADSCKSAVDNLNYADEDEEEEENVDNTKDENARIRARAKRRMHAAMTASRFVNSASSLVDSTMMWLLRIVIYEAKDE